VVVVACEERTFVNLGVVGSPSRAVTATVTVDSKAIAEDWQLAMFSASLDTGREQGELTR
jgi:hypothetical protein